MYVKVMSIVKQRCSSYPDVTGGDSLQRGVSEAAFGDVTKGNDEENAGRSN